MSRGIGAVQAASVLLAGIFIGLKLHPPLLFCCLLFAAGVAGGIFFYRRGKDYVLHRVLEVKDGYYHIRGDNTYSVEHVPDSAVIGVLTAFVRDGKKILVTDRKYQIYVRVWRHTYGLRVFYLRCRRLGSRVKHKLLG